jgi:hypothetical protein
MFNCLAEYHGLLFCSQKAHCCCFSKKFIFAAVILDFCFSFSFKVLLPYSMMVITNVLFIFSGFASGLLKVLEFN